MAWGRVLEDAGIGRGAGRWHARGNRSIGAPAALSSPRCARYLEAASAANRTPGRNGSHPRNSDTAAPPGNPVVGNLHRARVRHSRRRGGRLAGALERRAQSGGQRAVDPGRAWNRYRSPPTANRPNAPPGPQQQQAAAEPARPQPVEKTAELPHPRRSLLPQKPAELTAALAPEPKAELQSAAAPPQPLEKPQEKAVEKPVEKRVEKPAEKKHRQKLASRESAPSSAERKGERAAAPAPGASARNPDAVPNWKSQLVARLERYKRYPRGGANRAASKAWRSSPSASTAAAACITHASCAARARACSTRDAGDGGARRTAAAAAAGNHPARRSRSRCRSVTICAEFQPAF